ncbi:phasin family protein [Thermomonas flagellata]|uniref:phasin family protein n=1 Tax=Thermomonas flagellata TaxID=2888524 RepID=UPI001F047D15|nr:phasin family protein [Thermomonas flagellata]
MYAFNEQFNQAARQFADAAAQAQRLMLAHAEKTAGLQLSALEETTQATFAYWGELADVRDMDALKAVLPKGLQVARGNLERGIGVTQQVLAQMMKTGEALGALAKGQFEQAAAQAGEQLEKAAKVGAKAAK